MSYVQRDWDITSYTPEGICDIWDTAVAFFVFYEYKCHMYGIMSLGYIIYIYWILAAAVASIGFICTALCLGDVSYSILDTAAVAVFVLC